MGGIIFLSVSEVLRIHSDGVVLQSPVPGELERLTIEIVTGGSTKDQAADFFRQRTVGNN